MAVSLQKLCLLNNFNRITNIYVSTRYGHHLRGKPPGVARTLQDRFDGIKARRSYKIELL